MRRLTHRQAQVLRFIAAHVQERGFPPSIREIGAAFGMTSTRGAYDHIAALERKGCLVKIPHCMRAISLTAAGKDFIARGVAA
mgnify:CR=1 FL=1